MAMANNCETRKTKMFYLQQTGSISTLYVHITTTIIPMFYYFRHYRQIIINYEQSF